MIKILVVGGYDLDKDIDEPSQHVKEFAAHLGKTVIEHGHVLLNGCRTDFDTDIAEGALEQAGPAAIDERLRCYVPKGGTPAFTFGTQLASQLATWDPADGIDIIPEVVQEADVVVFVRGYKGLNQAAIWSDLAKKPMLPVASFGGAAVKLYHRELASFDEKYAAMVKKEAFQQLNSVIGDVTKLGSLADTVVSLAENVGSPDIKVGRSPGRSDQELCDLGRNRLIHGFFWDLPEQYFLASVDGRLRRPRSGWGACSAAAKSRRKVFNLWLLLDDRWAGDTAQVEPVR